MTRVQRKAIDAAFEGAVAFPPMWEEENGSIIAMIPMSFAGAHGDFPDDLEFDLIRVAPNGSVEERLSAVYLLRT